MFRVAGWLVVAYASFAAMEHMGAAVGSPDDGGVLWAVLFYLVLYFLVARAFRKYTDATWAETFPLRGFTPDLITPVLLISAGACVITIEMLQLIAALTYRPHVPWSADSAVGAGRLFAELVYCAGFAVICEEAMMRGIVLRALGQTMSNRRAILIAALFFAASHGTLERFPHTFLLGVIYGWMFLRTGSLLTAMFAHAFHNTVSVLLAHAGPWRGAFAVDEYGLLPPWMVLFAAVLLASGLVWFHLRAPVIVPEEAPESYQIAV